MSPEYAMRGKFSMKSDVFSFGVLILEIISGRKNSSFYQSDGADNLLSYVSTFVCSSTFLSLYIKALNVTLLNKLLQSWKHWTNETPLELLDSNLRANCSRNEVVRCIHIGLLCVQEDPANRPTMTRVGLMLDSYSVSLPLPQKPAFFLRSRNELSPQGKGLKSSDQSSSKSTTLSINEVSVTELEPR